MSAPSVTARRAAGPRLRHGFLAAALVVVAALRLVNGDVAWAAILGAAGLVETGLAMAHRRATARPEPAAAGELPEGQVLEGSLTGHRRNERSWLAGLVLCAVTGASVVSSEPSVGLVLGALSLVSLHQLRRERRSVATLERLRVRSLPQREGAT